MRPKTLTNNNSLFMATKLFICEILNLNKTMQEKVHVIKSGTLKVSLTHARLRLKNDELTLPMSVKPVWAYLIESSWFKNRVP